jgi:hypothetical protein
MADRELVIKIPEELLRYFDSFYLTNVNENKNVDRLVKILKNGTPLPKGHGSIGDLDKLIQAMKERNNDNGGEPLNAVDRGYDLACQHMVKEAKECVIIEANKENNDGSNI